MGTGAVVLRDNSEKNEFSKCEQLQTQSRAIAVRVIQELLFVGLICTNFVI